MHEIPVIRVEYIQDDPKGDRWRLLEDMTFQTMLGPITAPAGYVTDFASTPKVIWSFIPPFGPYAAAAVLHDWWYEKRLGEARFGPHLARKMADLQFYRDMRAADPEAKNRNRLMYNAVRLFGKSAWNGKPPL